MLKIEVVNKRNPQAKNTRREYIGRPSALGNPFPLKQESEREQVIKLYKLWLWTEMQDPNSKARKQLKELAAIKQDLELECYCSPKACHGDIIKDAINYLRDTK